MPVPIIAGLVSTIIPVHNRAGLLQEAVASVLAQSYRPIEVIVVDDGSTDDTPAVARALAARHNDEVIVVHQRNAGPGMARETGRRVARGEFVQYLDSDDVVLPAKFALQVAALRQHSHCDVAYGPTHYGLKGARVEHQPWKRTGEVISTMFPSFLQSRWWGTSTPLYRRSLTDKIGPWLDLRTEEDWEYDCRAAAMGTQLAFVPAFVSEQREHAGPRLSRHGSHDPQKLHDRAIAHTRVYQSAIEAGLDTGTPEVQHFARQAFLLARQCGAAGLATDSRDLFALAQKASGAVRSRGADFRVYRAAASILGWTIAGRIGCASDRFRKE